MHTVSANSGRVVLFAGLDAEPDAVSCVNLGPFEEQVLHVGIYPNRSSGREVSFGNVRGFHDFEHT